MLTRFQIYLLNLFSGRHTVAAMSRYDAEYMRYYTGISPLILTSFSGHYTKGNPYEPTR
jgi:hypothetical protein